MEQEVLAVCCSSFDFPQGLFSSGLLA